MVGAWTHRCLGRDQTPVSALAISRQVAVGTSTHVEPFQTCAMLFPLLIATDVHVLATLSVRWMNPKAHVPAGP